MPNSIALAKQYLPLLDEVYKYESKTSLLDTANNYVRFIGGNKVELFKTALQGLGDYKRNSGFVDGSVTATWEELTLTQDRGRSFMCDAMDDEETLGMAFGTLAGEFLRVHVIPEIDAYRIATYAANAGLTLTAGDITVGTTDIPAMIDEAEGKMNDEEVPEEGRILFLSELAYRGLKAKITRYVDNEVTGINRIVEMYDDMRIVRMPKARFNTAITLYDGESSGEEAGGFIPTASTGYPINFMIIHPSAVWQTVKHEVPRIFDPMTNQKANAWKFDYRIYHDCGVLANKTKGVLLYRGSTANT